jgi:hypothetical protein
MGDVINLRRARKDKARRDREADAATNRRLFGRTKTQKVSDRATKERERTALDDKRLDREED